MDSHSEAGHSAVAVTDWRIQTFALYAEVRELALLNPSAAHRLWRQRRNAMFREHPASALDDAKKSSFTALPVREYDPDFRWTCELTDIGAGARMTFQTGTDGEVPFLRLGSFDVPDVGLLAVWKLESYGGGIFLPFRDSTAGRPDGAYGAGRYLLDTIKGAHLGQVGRSFVLDFNFAYNPSCAYNEAWACPLPGKDNRVEAAIPVGEQYLPELAT
ncbi:DUF1684 domain-containing protein [Paenarthrobacter sp. Z7-10]|uniref:DUF1684 domain-containing protein n=1 Tax=Paenarthrobacter sp. Z7-10 TaxID=2787635 RepID=UPI0022A97C3A|nr:DUF1684 domain-containing protein [Paenarthrobacter sp. Z7-10]MCZ2404670.1 DUF1684 domain-containing protein [Paenarthrobacter sp. Z7-10]